jgi:hypothetical protein
MDLCQICLASTLFWLTRLENPMVWCCLRFDLASKGCSAAGSKAPSNQTSPSPVTDFPDLTLSLLIKIKAVMHG